MMQTRSRHVKNQMTNVKNLISYFKISWCADQKLYENGRKNELCVLAICVGEGY